MSSFTNFTSEAMLQYAREESKILKQDVWRVTEDFKYYLNNCNRELWVSVPRGYLTDGASVPRVLWALIPPHGAYGAAAIVHDILCEYLSITKNGLPYSISREFADNVLAEAMEVLGVSAKDRRLINLGVAGYRRVSGTKDPVWHKVKAMLEAKWVINNPKGD